MKYCSVSKGILTDVVTWMILEDVMLSEVSQSTKGQTLYDSICLRYPEESK